MEKRLNTVLTTRLFLHRFCITFLIFGPFFSFIFCKTKKKVKNSQIFRIKFFEKILKLCQILTLKENISCLQSIWKCTVFMCEY